jgi:hypothetical protein
MKLFAYLKSDTAIKSFFLEKKTEIYWRNNFPTSFNNACNVKSFYVRNKKIIVPGSLITLGSLAAYNTRALSGPSEGGRDNRISPPIAAFVDAMEIIKVNASLIAYTLSQTFGSVVNSAYGGLRQTLVESVVNLLQDLKIKLFTDPSTTKSRFPWWR